ncbi:hypothetical protein CKO36_17085, partial [Rhabdochromatium marinum]
MLIKKGKKSLLTPIFITLGISIPVGLMLVHFGIFSSSIFNTLSVVLLTAGIAAFVFYHLLFAPMQGFIDNLSQSLSDEFKANAQAHGYNDAHLKQHQTLGDRYDRLTQSVQLFHNNFNVLASQGSQIAIAAAELSFTADHLKSQLHQKVENISEINHSVEHIAANINSSSAASHTASKSAFETLEASDIGYQAIRHTVDQMQLTTQQPPAKAGGLKLRTESPDTGQIDPFRVPLSGSCPLPVARSDA